MAAFRRIQEFNAAAESFSAYVERVELFFQANGIREEKQVPVFLSSIGSATYGTLCDLLAPSNPKDKSFEQIVDTLKGHFEPKPLVIAERFHFHRRNQAPGESITEYIAKLRRLASKCDFRAYLEEALRDRLVCGLLSEPIQRALLSEVDLTLKRAFQVAQGMEAAHKNAQSLKASKLPVHRLDQPTRVTGSRSFSSFKSAGDSTGGKTCYRCGRSGHLPNDCRFKDVTCHTCEKKGHIALVCRSARRDAQRVSRGQGPGRNAHYVDTQQLLEDETQMIMNSSTKLAHPPPPHMKWCRSEMESR